MEGTSNGDPSTAQTSNNSANLVEIKIKTLDSQVYSCSVDQNITVPALKDHIATLTGVPAGNQRLICRGKVLKDDHTLTDYNVEDGHTLHLVTKQVPQSGLGASSAAANAGAEEQRADDSSNGATHNRPTQISHSVVMGTFNVPDNGDGGLPDVNRMISSVLQSLGLGNIVPHAGTNIGGPAVNPAIVAVAPAIGGQDGGIGGARPMNVLNHPATSDRGAGPMTWPIAGLGMLPAIGQQVRLLQQPTVTPDALTTINEYLDGLEQWFGQGMPPLDAVPTGSVPAQPVRSPIVIRGYPTPANLGATIQRTMSLINGQGVVELNRLSSELENEPNTTDTGARGELQSVALRDGVLLQHLGALLLELGRVTLTLQVGPSAMESAVNAGPAVFISPAGPNPMMVQPLPFQPGPGFGIPGAGSHHAAGAMGYPEVPRNVSIHIHANEPGTIPGFRAQGQGLATGNPPTQVPGMAPPVVAGTGSHTAPSDGVIPPVHAVAVPVQVGSSVSNEPGIRVVPMRTMVAAVPANLQGRSMVDGSGVHPSVLHPIFTRFQQLNSQHGGNPQGGTVASSTTALLPPRTSEQAASPAAPVSDGVAPDGQGFSRSSANDGLSLPMSTSQGPSSLIPQQDQQLRNTTESQTHLREAPTGISMKVNHAQSNDLQEERHGQFMGGNPDLAREMQSQADVVVKESYIKDDAIACQSREAADAEEKAKDGNKANVPTGLGFGGLQPLPARTPKRAGPQQQPFQVAGSSQQGAQSPENYLNNRQGGLAPLTGAECNAQGPPLMADSRNSPSQASQFFPLLNSSSSQRGGGTDLDIGTLMSQFANNANATATRPTDRSQGLSGAALGNLMGQVMQNPFMRNVVQQVVEQVGDHEDLTGHGESGNPQVGADFSRLLQQMMPVVSQAINRMGTTSAREGSLARNGGEAAARQGLSGFPDMQSNGSNVSNGPNISGILQQLMPVVAQAFGAASTGGLEQVSRMPGDVHLRNADGRESAAVQEQRNEAPVLGLRQPEAPPCEEPDSAPVVKRQKIDVQKALEKLEQGSPPTDILRVVTETAIMLLTRANNQEPNMPPLAHCLCEDDGLANDYMTLLLSDVASCTEEDI